MPRVKMTWRVPGTNPATQAFTEPVVEGIIERTRLRKGERDIIVFDPGVRGFHVRLFASGTVNYGVQVRVLRKTRRHALGPATKGRLKDAQKLAGEIIAKARLGVDLQAEKKAQQEEVPQTDDD